MAVWLSYTYCTSLPTCPYTNLLFGLPYTCYHHVGLVVMCPFVLDVCSETRTPPQGLSAPLLSFLLYPVSPQLPTLSNTFSIFSLFTLAQTVLKIRYVSARLNQWKPFNSKNMNEYLEKKFYVQTIAVYLCVLNISIRVIF